jgi:phage protein D
MSSDRGSSPQRPSAPERGTPLRPGPGHPPHSATQLQASLLEVILEDGSSLSSLLAVDVEEGPNRPASCRFSCAESVDLRDPTPDLDTLVDFGRRLKVEARALESDPVRIFDGIIYGLGGRGSSSGPRLREGTALDALQPLQMTRRSRSLHDLTPCEAFRLTAADHGLSTDLNLPGSVRDVIVQGKETDLAFLQRLAREVDGEFWVEGSRLLARAAEDRPGERLTLSAVRDLTEYRVFADLTGQRECVEIRGWSPVLKSALSASADASGLTSQSPGTVSGPERLAMAWPSPLRRPERPVSLGPEDETEAQEMASGRLRSRARGFVELQAELAGDPRVRVGTQVHIGDLGHRLSGVFRVSDVRHSYNSLRGYRTAFRANRREVRDG